MNPSFLPFLLRLAFRNIRRNWRRSGFTITAVGFGLFCLVVFQAMKNGLHQEMVRGTVGLDAGSVQIHAPGFEPNLAALLPIENHEEVLAVAEKLAPAAPRLKTPALLLAGRKSSSVILSGVDPGREPDITFIAKKIVAGDYLRDEDGVLLGEPLARSLDVKPGDTVRIMTQGFGGKPVAGKFTVSGVFSTGNNMFDRGHAYGRLAAVQKFLAAEGVVTEIALAPDRRSTRTVMTALSHRFSGDRVSILSWEEALPDLTQLIALNDATMRLLILIVFAIVAIGIANTMTMATFERFREMGVMAAVGTTPAEIVAMVVCEAMALALVAAVIGTGAGGAACFWLARHGIDLSRFLSANQYLATSHILRADPMLVDFVAANAVTLVTTVLASIYPAGRAARLDPARAIGHV